MLFNNYNKNDDLFYQKQLEIYSKNELNIIEKTCLDIPDSQLITMEVILRRIVLSPYLSLNEVMSTKDFLCILLLHVPYITHSYLINLHIFPTESAVRKFIYRNTYSDKNKKGILRSFDLNGNNIRKAYALTTAGRNYAKNLLPDEYIKQYTNLPSSISGNQHDVALLCLFYRLINDNNYHYFRWHNSPLIKDGSTVDEALHNNGIFEKDEKGLKPDAIMENVEEIGDYIFVEQDMRTESKGLLIEKFNRYASFFSTVSLNEQFSYQICFTILTERSRSGFIVSSVTPSAAHENSSSKLNRMKKEMFNLIASVETDEQEINISILRNILSSKLKNKNLKIKYPATYSTFSQLNSILETILTEKPLANSVDDIKEYFNRNISGQIELTSAMSDWNSENMKDRRMETIREAAMDSELKQYLLNGVNLICLNCSNLTDLQGIFIEEYMESHLKRYAIPAINKKIFGDNSLQYNYEPAVALTNGKKFFIMRHSFQMNGHDNIHLIFENISDNIGGESRTRSLLSNKKIDNGKIVYLFLLVSSSSDAIKFNSSFDVPLNITFQKENEYAIYINYINYAGKNLSKPFYFSKNGSITYYNS